jgi:hypothetical protein
MSASSDGTSLSQEIGWLVEWFHLNSLHLKPQTESTLRNVLIEIKERRIIYRIAILVNVLIYK